MLWIVRHGQTANNAAGLLQGRADLPLTELGAQQAARVAATLATQLTGPVRVVASPLVRAQQTAGAIAEALGAHVEAEPRLLEIDYGQWEGRPLLDVSAQEWAAWRADLGFAPPGGESLEAVAARATAFAAEAVAHDGDIVAVSHVAPIKAMVAWALGASQQATWRMHLDLAAVSKVASRNGQAVLLGYNLVY